MIAEFVGNEAKGLMFKHSKPIELSNRVRVVGTRGLLGYGMIIAIVLQGKEQCINISWASPTPYELKPGDKVKFTRQ
jgi:hypothetical protein